MARFKPYDYDQHAMVVINYLEQLQPGTFEHAVHYLIEHKLDLSVFHPKYRKRIIPASEFQFEPVNLTCQCPAGHQISYRGIREDTQGIPRAYFEGRLLQCRYCPEEAPLHAQSPLSGPPPWCR